MEQVSTISEPKSMKELFSALYEAGELWREENKEIKEITRGDRKGEIEEKIPVPAIEDVQKHLENIAISLSLV